MADLSPINFVTGTLGSGKSYFAMRYVLKYLAAGKPVFCNFDLVGNWWDTVYQMRQPGYMKIAAKLLAETADDWRARQDEIAQIRSLAYRFDRQDDMYDYDLPSEGEDQALIVLDEGALRMNSREWAERQKREKEQYGTGLRSLQWFINMRKLGYSCLVLAHSEEQLDNQVRHMGGAVIRCRNLAKIRIPIIKAPVFRKPRFVAIHIWPETKPPHIYNREVYGLNMTIARHYRSLERFEADPSKVGLRRQSERRTLGLFPSQPATTWDEIAADRSRRKAARTAVERPPSNGLGGNVGAWRTARADRKPS